MKALRALLLIASLSAARTLLAPPPAAAQELQSRVLATTIGAVAGIAAGGYLTVSVVVLEARFGRYVHDIDDIIGWRAAPLLIGTAAGAGLGFSSPERLQGAVVYGAGGLALGALLGMAVGSSIWEPPEGRWAGAAIGAGVGLIIGNTIGIFNPVNLFTESDDGMPVQTNGVPLAIRIPL